MDNFNNNDRYGGDRYGASGSFGDDRYGASDSFGSDRYGAPGISGSSRYGTPSTSGVDPYDGSDPFLGGGDSYGAEAADQKMPEIAIEEGKVSDSEEADSLAAKSENAKVDAGNSVPSPRSRRSKVSKYLSNSELATFANQMSIILKSGISAIEGLEILRDDAGDQTEKKRLDILLQGVIDTGWLHQAMDRTPEIPPYMVQMIKIGEETGNLDEVMVSLRDHYEREEEIRTSIRSAVLYPLLMTAMMLAVILVLVVYVMPVFNQVFQELGASMNGFSLMIMNLGLGLRKYTIVLVLLAALVLCGLLAGVFTETGRKLRYRLGSHFRSIRGERAERAACRFASVMSMTIRAGLHPEEGLALASELNEDPDFGIRLTELSKDVAAGNDFAEALRERNIFSGVYARMASLGFRAGATDQVMEQIAGLYQDAIDTRLSNRLAVLEPALVITMSVLVGVILLSVMFPLLGIMASM